MPNPRSLTLAALLLLASLALPARADTKPADAKAADAKADTAAKADAKPEKFLPPTREESEAMMQLARERAAEVADKMRIRFRTLETAAGGER